MSRGALSLLLASLVSLPSCAPRPAAPPVRPAVRTGLDRLAASGFAELRGRRVGLICNPSSVDAEGRHAIDLLRQAPGVGLAAIFAPEHGLRGTETGEVGHGIDGPNFVQPDRPMSAIGG